MKIRIEYDFAPEEIPQLVESVIRTVTAVVSAFDEADKKETTPDAEQKAE